MDRHHIFASVTNYGRSIGFSSMKTIWIMGAIFLACPSFACAHAAAQDDAGAPPAITTNQTEQETESYWTPERMREAKPMPMPVPSKSWQPPTIQERFPANAPGAWGVSQDAGLPDEEIAPYGR